MRSFVPLFQIVLVLEEFVPSVLQCDRCDVTIRKIERAPADVTRARALCNAACS